MAIDKSKLLKLLLKARTFCPKDEIIFKRKSIFLFNLQPADKPNKNNKFLLFFDGF